VKRLTRNILAAIGIVVSGVLIYAAASAIAVVSSR